MGREIENPRIQIWKASKSIFHRLGEQDPESEEERPGPGSHGQGLSPVWLCITAWPPRAQEPNPVPPPFLPPPRDPQRPAAQPDTTRQLRCSQMPRGSSGVALGSSATLGGGGRGRVPELGSGAAASLAAGVWDSLPHRWAPGRLSAAVGNGCTYLAAVEG